MWFENQILFPRTVKGFACDVFIQQSYLCALFFILRLISWNPFSAVLDWFLCLFHWKTLFYQLIASFCTVAFGILNERFYTVEKHISLNRFKRICHVVSPKVVQHFLLSSLLGALTSYSCLGLFQSFDPEKKSILGSFLILEDNFDWFFAIEHGFYTGFMFSLKYFICNLYIVKLSLIQESKVLIIRHQLRELVKDSVLCVLKSLPWFYFVFLMIEPLRIKIFLSFNILSESESWLNILYSMLNLKLFLATFLSGAVIFLNWSLFLCVLNAFMAERHIFPIEMPVKTEKDKSLSVTLLNAQSQLLKHLAILDMRLLSQHDVPRRKQIFTISHPGGHAHQWKALSNYCIAALKDFVTKLQQYSLESAAKESQTGFIKGHNTTMNEFKITQQESSQEKPKYSRVLFGYVREWPTVAYFLDELPTAKIQQILSVSQPLVWMIEALGFLVSASYTEDKYGVIQQTLPEIICLLLDIKMAEEKLPLDLVGIRVQVKDPQGRYEHIHQRVALKTSVNASLCRIAETFKLDIKGIYLPEEYHRYFQRYLTRKNV